MKTVGLKSFTIWLSLAGSLLFLLGACSSDEVSSSQYSSLQDKVLQNVFNKATIEAKQYQTAQQLGIDVTLMESVADLPKDMRLQYKAIELSPAELSDLTHGIKVLPAILSKYPVNILQETLNHIYIFKELLVDDIYFAGTYHDNTIYIQSDTSQQMAATVHHELSTLFAKLYSFPITEWMNSSSEIMPYKLSFEATEQISKSDDSLVGTVKLFQEGYLSAYSTMDPENDLNLYAQTIFTTPDVMATLIQRYPKISTRYEIVKQFYLDIDPGFKPVFDNVDNH